MQSVVIAPAASSRGFDPAVHNRRRRVRHKVHTPAYARLTSASAVPATDFNQIINISEQGIAIQTAQHLDANSHLEICLDLSDIGASVLTQGRVIWSDDAGRSGIFLPHLEGEQLARLKQWLFLNAITACVDHNDLADSAVAAEVAPAVPLESHAVVLPRHLTIAPSSPDYTTLLAALAAVQREVEALGADLDAALLLITRRVEAFTRASGAAIALSEGAGMVCRASSGRDAPGLGVRLKVGSGFSGECVRTGKLLRCDDSESDALADRESCRLLGIRSMVAAPICWGSAVIGLLEVFSPQPFNFRADDEKILLELADLASAAVYRAGAPRTPSQEPLQVDDEFPVEPPIQAAVIAPLSRPRKILLCTAGATIVLAAAWVMMPWGRSGSISQIQNRPQAQAAVKSVAASEPGSLPALRTLAERGDVNAEFALGSRYATGEDVPQDYSEAVRWFALAADQGHVISQATLGAYYWAGRGVPQDLVKAYFWSVLAQTGGDEASKYRVELLASRMTRSQVIAAQQQANDWIKQHQLVSNLSAPR